MHITNLTKQGYCNHFVCSTVCLCCLFYVCPTSVVQCVIQAPQYMAIMIGECMGESGCGWGLGRGVYGGERVWVGVGEGSA